MTSLFVAVALTTCTGSDTDKRFENGAVRPAIIGTDLETHVARRVAAAKLRLWAANSPDAPDRDRLGAIADADGLESIDYLESCFARLDQAKNDKSLDSALALSVVQAAETASSRLWGLPPKLLSAAVNRKAAELPQRIEDWVDAVASARSKRGYLHAKKAYEKALRTHRDEQSLEQARISAITQAVRTVSRELETVSHSGTRRELGELINSLGEMRAEATRQQIEEYNRWTVEQCRLVFDAIVDNDTWAPGDGVGTPEARSIFTGRGDNKRVSLARINQTALTVETSRLLNDLIQRLFANMTPDAIIKSETEAADASNKVPLANF